MAAIPLFASLMIGLVFTIIWACKIDSCPVGAEKYYKRAVKTYWIAFLKGAPKTK